jgi:hypothetical protein
MISNVDLQQMAELLRKQQQQHQKEKFISPKFDLILLISPK